MKGLYRHSGFTMIAGILIFAAVLLALQIGLAPALGQNDPPDDAEIVYGEIIADDAARDYTCTSGPTGNCSVVYVLAAVPSEEEAIEACGSAICVARIEFRW